MNVLAYELVTRNIGRLLVDRDLRDRGLSGGRLGIGVMGVWMLDGICRMCWMFGGTGGCWADCGHLIC